jgi:uncharacterized membrane protein SpoIIM required for sporulation
MRRHRRNKVFEKYMDCWDYLKESRQYILFIIALFVFFVVIGFASLDSLKKYNDSILDMMMELRDETAGMNGLQLFFFIFQNNLKSAFMGLAFGFFFGIFPVVNCIVNGYVIGFVASVAVDVTGGPGVLFRLLPHGIFEIPALVISLAMGTKLGLFFIPMRDKKRAVMASLASFFMAAVIFMIAMAVFSAASLSLLGEGKDIVAIVSGSAFLMTMVLLLAVGSFILGVAISLSFLTRGEKEVVRTEFRRTMEYSLKVFLFVVLPLLFVAGMIESSLMILFP